MTARDHWTPHSPAYRAASVVGQDRRALRDPRPGPPRPTLTGAAFLAGRWFADRAETARLFGAGIKAGGL